MESKTKKSSKPFAKSQENYLFQKTIKDLLYTDSALPIDCGQTISQPFIVAYMTEKLQLQPNDKVLEIGTGSGFQTAVLAQLAKEVYTIEFYPELSQKAQKLLTQLGYQNIFYHQGDGSLG